MKRGRPQSVIFTPTEGKKLAGLYLASNKDSTSGSATMAARVYAASHEPLAEALDRRSSKHSLPQAVWDAVAPAQRLVRYKREGERGLRNATYTPGLLRLNSDRTRRLLALERVSWDDGTVNFGVCIPWPFGGDKCSQEFGVKLGRFQLLLPHDDGTSMAPAWNFVIKASQAYGGTDVTGAMLRFARDVGIVREKDSNAGGYLIEGGAWQSKRVMAALAALGIPWVDAKGRPECKLVENFFNRLWTRLSIELPFAQVGRFRADDKKGQDLYCDCQAGRKDPRKYFPMLDQAMSAMETSLRWLNTEPIESREYGTWIPLKRWMADLAEFPHPKAEGDHLWLAAPCLEERVVRRGMIQATAPGPLGLQTTFHFSSPDLWSHERNRVLVAFDPLSNPCTATVADPKTRKVLCEAVSVDPEAHDNPDEGVRVARALRQLMRREYRVLLPDAKSGAQRVQHSETEIRSDRGMVEVRSGTLSSTPHHNEAGVPDGVRLASMAQMATERPRGEMEASSTPRASRADLGNSLRRRAARIAAEEHAL